jgi:site-specific recombinase XerD
MPTRRAHAITMSLRVTTVRRSHGTCLAGLHRSTPLASDHAGLSRWSSVSQQETSLPADPPPGEEIIRVMRTAGDGPAADRLRGLIVVLWRSGLRISEALALAESDLDRGRGAILVRRAKGGKRREVGMDSWGWEQLDPWLQVREQLPVGALFCIICGPTRGRPWTQDAVRVQLRRTAAQAAVRRRFAPHQLRHAHAVEMAREGVPMMVIQRQLGHANLGITSIYLQGIDNAEIMDTVHHRATPVIPASAGLHRPS